MVRIGFVLAEFFVFYKFNGHRHEAFGARLRQACERLGLVFIKIGQILSTRYDLLSREDCEELQKLLDAVPPFPREEVQRIFMADFGRGPEDCFDSFDPQPIASASISQVYKAVLNGKKVAVKVRRPGVTNNLRADARILSSLSRVARMFYRRLRGIDFREIVRQAESWMEGEADFLNETVNIEAVCRYYDSGARERVGAYAQAIVFPRPHREYCSRNVLTMDFLEGVVARDFRLASDSGYDPAASLYNLVRAVLKTCLTEKEFYFHGDPHPSNLLIMEDGQIGLLDLGLLGKLDERDMHLLRDLILAVYIQDVDRATALVEEFCGAPAGKYTKLIRQELPAYFKKAHESGLGYWFTGLVDIALKHRVPFPYNFVLFGRMQTILDGVFQAVVPGKTTVEILGEELDNALRRRMFDNLREIDIVPILYALTESIKKSPRKLPAIFDRYIQDPLQLVRDISSAARGK